MTRYPYVPIAINNKQLLHKVKPEKTFKKVEQRLIKTLVELNQYYRDNRDHIQWKP